jgi:hypothetical protein
VENRRLGKTDMDVPMLGFGDAEIGFENVSQEVADCLLTSALDHPAVIPPECPQEIPISSGAFRRADAIAEVPCTSMRVTVLMRRFRRRAETNFSGFLLLGSSRRFRKVRDREDALASTRRAGATQAAAAIQSR